MRDAEPAGRTNQLGVVDPIRVPGADRVGRIWKRLPPLAQVFVALALVDLVARAFGVLGLSLEFDLAAPLAVLLILPHLALVLLPAVILLRRKDAATATPLVLWGGVTLAIVELFSAPLFAIFPGMADSLGTWTLLHAFAALARAGAWVVLAAGLRAVTRSLPGPALQGASNGVLFVIAGSALTSLLLLLLLPVPDLGDATWTSQVQLVNAIGILPTIAFAYLGRTILRGTTDLQRPVVATYTATGAVALAALEAFLTLGVNVLVLVQLMFALSGGPIGPGFGIGIPLIGTGMVSLLLVVAFGLGLADTSVRMPRTSKSEESPA